MLFWAAVQTVDIWGNVGPRHCRLRLPDGSICQNMLFSKTSTNIIQILQFWGYLNLYSLSSVSSCTPDSLSTVTGITNQDVKDVYQQTAATILCFEKSLFQLKWQHQHCKKIVVRVQMYLLTVSELRFLPGHPRSSGPSAVNFTFILAKWLRLDKVFIFPICI